MLLVVPQVSRERLWLTVAQNLGMDPRVDSTLGGQLKQAYATIIKPFDIYLESMHLAGAHNNGGSSSPQKESPVASTSSTPKSSTNKPASPPSSVVTKEQVQLASDRLNSALSNNNKDTADAAMSYPVDNLPRSGVEAGEACEVCLQDHDPVSSPLCTIFRKKDECDCLSSDPDAF